ncbi:hypothetical protein D3C83_224180 [compost metagenome]
MTTSSLFRVGDPIAIELTMNHGHASHCPASMVASSGKNGDIAIDFHLLGVGSSAIRYTRFPPGRA